MESVVNIPDVDKMQMALIHSYFHFDTHSYNYLLQTQPGEAKRGYNFSYRKEKFHYMNGSCHGERGGGGAINCTHKHIKGRMAYTGCTKNNVP